MRRYLGKKEMAFDFSITDLKNSFTVDGAAMAWCEIETLSECQEVRFVQMRSALVEAMQSEELEADLAYKTGTEYIRGGYYDVDVPDYYRSAISRKALLKWALLKGQKPKFLFPEMRDISPAVSPAAIVEAPPISLANPPAVCIS